MKLRENQEEGYNYAYDCLFRKVVGTMPWKRMIRGCTVQTCLSNNFSVSDEAFGLLIVENDWDKIEGQVSSNMEDKKRQGGKYTNMNRAGNCAFDGWSMEGLQRYNDLCALVIQDREKNRGFDMKYIQDMIGKNGNALEGMLRKKQSTKEKEMREAFRIYDGNAETATEFEARHRLSRNDHNQEEAPAIEIAEEQEGVEYQAARLTEKRVRTKAKERDNHRPRKRKNRSFGSHLGPRMPTTSKGTRSEEKRLRSQT